MISHSVLTSRNETGQSAEFHTKREPEAAEFRCPPESEGRPRARDICCGGREGPGQFTNSPVDVRLAPQDAGAVVEQVEVMGVIPFLLDYLQLYVLVIQSIVQDLGVLIGQGETMVVEEGCDLLGPHPVAEA